MRYQRLGVVKRFAAVLWAENRVLLRGEIGKVSFGFDFFDLPQPLVGKGFRVLVG